MPRVQGSAKGTTLRRAALTRVLPSVLNFDSKRKRARSRPNGRAARFQCAVAMRDVLESGLTGAVRVCFEQHCLKAASTSGSTTHSDLRHTVDISLITR